MAVSSEKKTTRAQQKARRPREILDAAFEVFTQKGYESTRVEDIAARLGLTKGAVYLYFQNKDILFESMIYDISIPFSELLRDYGSIQGNNMEKLNSLLRMAYGKIVSDRKIREMLRLCIAEGRRFPGIIQKLNEEFFIPLIENIRTIIKTGTDNGEFRQNCSCETADVLVSPVIHIIITQLIFSDNPPVDYNRFIDTHIIFVQNALKP